MAAGVMLAATAALLAMWLPSVTLAQERCAYFTAVPRDPTPDYEVEDFTGVPWSVRPLLPPAARDDICVEDYTAAMGAQIIHIEEEIVGEVIVARINYEGTATPVVGSFLTGQRVQLNPVIRREPELDNAWHLVITERQDYETESMRLYMFNVDVWESETGNPLRVLVSLAVVNIDDNAPVIQLLSDCTVPELGEPRATECVYDVTDADGAISTVPMYFVVAGSRDEDQLFTFDELRYEDDLYRVTITLRILSPLDFAARALHIFTVTAYDSLPNQHEVSLLVQVENVEHRPPRWVEIWAMQQFDEKTTQRFTVSAIDGDTGIDKQILYRLNKPDNYTFFSIGNEDGVFEVSEIDRDALEQEVFQLQIVAYKFDNESFSAESNVVIIVNDVNDQTPNPLEMVYEVDILEETPMSITFEGQEFGFHDRDLGENAQYRVYLESVTPAAAADAFSVAPEQGYQRQTFIMSVLHHSSLDYELLDWQHIELDFVAVELLNPEHTNRSTVRVNLINWNDEVPVFEQESYEVSFEETVGAGHHVAVVRAHDRDIDDHVVHSLMGNAVTFLDIDPDTGAITVSIDDAFDYLRQSDLYVQVAAVDTLGDGPYHTTTAQLHIQLIDVNNNPPQLRLPRNPPIVEENVPVGYLITSEIFGTDPDTSADIYFEIEWESSYATKQGRQVDPLEYVGCVEIETVYPDELTRGSANGSLVVREIRPGVTIDFEEFEVLYLTVRVVDSNQVVGDDYAASTFTVIIEDMNDNWPIWTQSTLETALSVREGSATGVVIGSVHATDIDGPIYNQIVYSILPRLDTPAELVRIDPQLGQIEVLTAGAIDADQPPRESLYYTVVASDCCTVDCPPPDETCWNMPAEITIRIIDTNNKPPEPQDEEYGTTVYIYEDATTGDEVVQLYAGDLDRDEIYHTLAYQINYAVNSGLRDLFAVELETGWLHVNYTGDRVLDRDRGEPQHTIFLNVIDNFYSEGDGNRNQVEINVTVVLLDVNDNAPELPPPAELSWSVSEALTEGAILSPDIYAPDIDEPDTDNSRVSYAVLALARQGDEAAPPELFGMINVDNVTGELYCRQDLRGHWGTYGIHILAYDFGIPQMSSNETYELVVRPYNFHAPQFVFPVDGSTIRLARERANVNGPLALVSGEFLERVAATDEDGLHAGLVTFAVTGDALAEQYFTVVNDGTNLGTLMLTQEIADGQYEFQVTITATDQGTEPGALSGTATVRVVLAATLGDPVFESNDDSAAFFEFEDGLEEMQQLRLAEDPKNLLCEDDCHDIYYHIIEGNDAGHFRLEATSNVLGVATQLERAAAERHELLVAATNAPAPPDVRPAATSLLRVTVHVREANPQPRFQRDLYTAGISTGDLINRELLTVVAVHSEGDTIEYAIDSASMTVDSSLEAVRDSAFVLAPHSGVLTLNMQPTASMHGMFEFDITATDSAGASDRTAVKVYLISTMNRVYFTFVNTLTQVEQDRDFIAQTLSVGFNMTCNIDQVVPASDDNGVALDDLTELRTHFIQDDVPVDADIIEQKRSDTALLRQVQTTLSTQLLILQDFVTDTSAVGGGGAGGAAQSVLAALAAALACACALLLLAYIFKTRALTRRLQALSTTKFGSQDSGLNRAGAIVPGTNKHAVEGSNPIWNEQIKAPDFDALSETSGDSDLIGIEDYPQFNYDYFPPSGGDSRAELVTDADLNQGGGDAVAAHDNRFNFNTTPFSPGFASKALNRY